MSGHSFVTTYPNGDRRIFANVGNPTSFRKAMAAIGNRVEDADEAAFTAAGFDDGGEAFKKAVATLQILKLPNGSPQPARATASVASPYIAGYPPPVSAVPSPQPAKPERVSLPAMMRKRYGLQTPEELEAEKASRGSLAQLMDKVVASRGYQQQAKARR